MYNCSKALSDAVNHLLKRIVPLAGDILQVQQRGYAYTPAGPMMKVETAKGPIAFVEHRLIEQASHFELVSKYDGLSLNLACAAINREIYDLVKSHFAPGIQGYRRHGRWLYQGHFGYMSTVLSYAAAYRRRRLTRGRFVHHHKGRRVH